MHLNKIKRKNKMIYANGKLTRTQNSQASLKTTSRLPSVMRNKPKTSLDFLHKTKATYAKTSRNTRNFGYSSVGFRSGR